MHNTLTFRLAIVIAAVAAWAGAARAGTITQWDFNGESTSPTTGNGTLSLIGGVTFDSWDSGSSSDSASTNRAYVTTSYPSATSSNKTAGIQCDVSMAGYESIVVSFDLRTSNTSSKYYSLEYSTDDGTTWIDAMDFTSAGGDTWNDVQTVDLSSITGVNNNADFAFCVVAAFDSSSGSYTAAKSSKTYATTGKYRFDMITVSGTVVPEPASLTLAIIAGVVGLLAFGWRRRV